MSEDKYPAFSKFAALLRDRDRDIDLAFGEVVVQMCKQPHVSLAVIARQMLSAGFSATEIVVGLEAGEELRAMNVATSAPRSDVLRRRDRERQQDRRDECDAETWAVLRDAVIRRDGFSCVYCGTCIGPFEADHVMPLSRGGRSSMRNLVCACRPCNSAKRDRTSEEWRGEA